MGFKAGVLNFHFHKLRLCGLACETALPNSEIPGRIASFFTLFREQAVIKNPI